MAPTSDILRTNNPASYTLVDGVVIDSRTPPSSIQGIGNDIVCVIGEFQKGPVNAITDVGSAEEFGRIFGGFGPDAAGSPYKGYLAIARGKTFPRLRVIRVSNTTQATAQGTITDGAGVPVNIITAKAASPGVWGNSVSVTVAAASDGVASHFNLQVFFNGVQVETLQNLDHAAVVDGADYPITSDYVKLTRITAGDGTPAPGSTSLATGSDGTFADSDYVGVSTPSLTGMQLLTSQQASDIRWVFCAETGSATVNAALLALVTGGLVGSKVAIVCGLSSDTPSAAQTAVSTIRSDRLVYTFNHPRVYFPEANGGAGAVLTVAPTSFAAATIASLPPGVNPAGVNGSDFLHGISGLSFNTLTLNDYENFRAQGIMALEFSAERQVYSWRSGITSSLTPALKNVARRSIADYLENSIAAFLVNFQNKPYTQDNQLQIQHAIQDFLDRTIRDGLLPDKATVNAFKKATDPVLLPYVVDILSGNSPATAAQGIFVVILRVRTLASMDFIVLRTEIGESVSIVEQAA